MQNVLIQAMQPGASTAATMLSSLAPKAEAGGTPPFGNLLKYAINNVQQLEAEASQATQGLMRGDGVDIHTAMIATQKADLSFELALSVRNKAVAAYQQVMGMQF